MHFAQLEIGIVHNWWRTRALGFHQKIQERKINTEIRKKTRGLQLVLYQTLHYFWYQTLHHFLIYTVLEMLNNSTI